MVKEFGEIEQKEFINQSFFLYHKSNTIKKTFITVLNKEISIYGSLSFFSGKKKLKSKKLKLFDVSNSLKFLVEKKVIRERLELHLAYLNGGIVNTSNQKIHDFSITRLGKRKKTMQSRKTP